MFVLLFIASPHPIKDRVPGFAFQSGLKGSVYTAIEGRIA